MRVPGATYRFQVNDDFTLDDARVIVAYLADLGITDIYLSPIFEARRGSPHGYDITDPTRIRESLGGIDALERLRAETRHHGMGILLDIVPNHMAASAENPWWRDVLLHGAASPAARFFDIDWGSTGRMQLPVLPDELERMITDGDISIDAGTEELSFDGRRLPLDTGTAYGDIRAVLARQAYELVPWRNAASAMSYRRFFDIADLAAVRVEDDDVFRATHTLIRDLAHDGVITGLRVDHIDGLRDPAHYLRQLRSHVRDPAGSPVFTLVEKILAHDEQIPTDWECEGTTGYEFLRLTTGLLIEPDGLDRINEFHQRITGDTRVFGEIVRAKKLMVMRRLLGGELDRLARDLAQLASLELDTARGAILEVTASLSVYRTYIRIGHTSEVDRERIAAAVDDARHRTADAAIIGALDQLLNIALPASTHDDEHLEWVMDWQQFTGPVMAKGFEDTALYCHNALIAANDVGCDPAAPQLTATDLFDQLVRRHHTAPYSLNATATHDTKRGEDTRARIAVLSELADEWRTKLEAWIPAPTDGATQSADVESLLYQTLLGAWPLDGVNDQFARRIKEYMAKAVREANEQTSWRRPDEDYEQALETYIGQLMAEFGIEGRADDVGAFATRLAPHGALNAITHVLLKVTAPGIPDFYQGTELWSHTLVDPDNRQPVDFTTRSALFADIAPLLDSPDGQRVQALLAAWRDGRIKMYVTAAALRLRAARRDVFERGSVVTLPADGTRAENVFAFARQIGPQACITILPRWTTALGDTAAIDADGWRGTVIPLPDDLGGEWRDVITGATHHAAERIDVREWLKDVPFAIADRCGDVR